MRIESSSFGTLLSGRPVTCYTLTNANGAFVEILNYGGIIRKWCTPGPDGTPVDIVLGFDHILDYEKDISFQGALVGRVGNRIAKGELPYQGGIIQLDQNDGENALHGGYDGYHRKVWQAEVDPDHNRLVLRRSSLDGEENYPGRVEITVTYTFSDDNELRLDYQATTDKETYINMTNHVYFNLGGHNHGTIADHIAQFEADRYAVSNRECLVTGEIADVSGTPMDYRQGKAFADAFDHAADFEQLNFFGGIDHSFVVNQPSLENVCCTVTEPKSGRTLSVRTDQPALHVYTGNNMPDSMDGKDGATYPKRGAFCLETQHLPDAPHHDNFDSIVLKPGETYQASTIYQLRTK